MSRARPTEKQLQNTLRQMPDADRLASHYWLSQIWKTCIFSSDYAAAEQLGECITPTALGSELIAFCCTSYGVLEPDAKLALYGLFCWHEILIDTEQSRFEELRTLISNDLLNARIRLPYIWGRDLHDIFNDDPTLSQYDALPHDIGWRLLDGTAIGVFQHGTLVTGPLGVLQSAVHRWLPVSPAINVYFQRGASRNRKQVAFATAHIGVVTAYAAIEHYLSTKAPAPLPWNSVLRWYSSSQLTEQRSDYADIAPVVADCIIGPERAALLEAVLKSPQGSRLRTTIKNTTRGRSLSVLSPQELPGKLDTFEQLQLLLTIDTETLVACIDRLVLNKEITIPPSEVRYPKRNGPTKNVSFRTELSSLGIRPAHPEPFAALCSSVLRAYTSSKTLNELRWRLGCDVSRVIPAALTEYLRNHGPAEAVPQLILASHAVTEFICKEIGLAMSEVSPKTERTVPRILWKFGFEIPRHDELLPRLHRRLNAFEELVTQSDLSGGEEFREKIRAEGVNLFVSIEAFLDRLLSYNVWLLSSDHWGATRFEYRISEARASVALLLGDSISGPDGRVSWKVNGENALGAQLSYLSAFEAWLDKLSDPCKFERKDIDQLATVDEFNREFPFRHTVLWADSDIGELERYKGLVKMIIKSINQSQVSNVRNGIDHHREGARFPTEGDMMLCVSRLKAAVSQAERNRVYPVGYWFESQTEKVFGSTEYSFRSYSDELLTTYRPATVSSLPSFTRMQPVIFSPVNFLAAADGLLHFKVMGESEFSRHWTNYPRISRHLPDKDGEMAQVECDPIDGIPENLDLPNGPSGPLS